MDPIGIHAAFEEVQRKLLGGAGGSRCVGTLLMLLVLLRTLHAAGIGAGRRVLCENGGAGEQRKAKSGGHQFLH